MVLHGRHLPCGDWWSSGPPDRNHTAVNYVVYLAQVFGEATGLVPEGRQLTPPAVAMTGRDEAIAVVSRRESGVWFRSSGSGGYSPASAAWMRR